MSDKKQSKTLTFRYRDVKPLLKTSYFSFIRNKDYDNAVDIQGRLEIVSGMKGSTFFNFISNYIGAVNEMQFSARKHLEQSENVKKKGGEIDSTGFDLSTPKTWLDVLEGLKDTKPFTLRHFHELANSHRKAAKASSEESAAPVEKRKDSSVSKKASPIHRSTRIKICLLITTMTQALNAMDTSAIHSDTDSGLVSQLHTICHKKLNAITYSGNTEEWLTYTSVLFMIKCYYSAPRRNDLFDMIWQDMNPSHGSGSARGDKIWYTNSNVRKLNHILTKGFAELYTSLLSGIGDKKSDSNTPNDLIGPLIRCICTVSNFTPVNSFANTCAFIANDSNHVSSNITSRRRKQVKLLASRCKTFNKAYIEAIETPHSGVSPQLQAIHQWLTSIVSISLAIEIKIQEESKNSIRKKKAEKEKLNESSDDEKKSKKSKKSKKKKEEKSEDSSSGDSSSGDSSSGDSSSGDEKVKKHKSKKKKNYTDSNRDVNNTTYKSDNNSSDEENNKVEYSDISSDEDKHMRSDSSDNSS